MNNGKSIEIQQIQKLIQPKVTDQLIGIAFYTKIKSFK